MIMSFCRYYGLGPLVEKQDRVEGIRPHSRLRSGASRLKAMSNVARELGLAIRSVHFRSSK
jgi:hypothetical protein